MARKTEQKSLHCDEPKPKKIAQNYLQIKIIGVKGEFENKAD